MFDYNKIYNSSLLPWLTDHGPKIIAIILIAVIFDKFGHIFLERLIKKAVRGDHYLSKEAEEKRESTLIKVFNASIHVIVWILAGMMVLSEAGINIGPLLAAAGVAGLAFGFGGQYLIRDIISGFFIILENQYRVGDVICINKTCGLVEDINLRLTILRDLDGTVHHIPNGEIATASNLTKGFSRININIGVSYNTDIEKLIYVIDEVGKDLSLDPEWADQIIDSPKFLRLDDFADSSIIVKILGDTKPLKQWAVAGEFRKRLKIAFDKNEIEIPYPQRVVHLPNKNDQ